MILLQIELRRIAAIPAEGDSPRSIDCNCVTLRFATQGMEVETGHIQVEQRLSAVECVKSPQEPVDLIGPNMLRSPSLEEFLETLVPEAYNHEKSVNRLFPLVNL